MRTEININLHNNAIILTLADLTVKAAIGRHGLIGAKNKIEGDGKTPIGQWPIRKIYFRPDRVSLPPVMVETTAITRNMGWCDDPDHPLYNQEVSLPFEASHEVLWRDDHAYDVMIPLGYNDDPPVAGRGSAIFFHILHEGRHYTEGCVAIGCDDMLTVLTYLTADSVMIIQDQM